MAILVKTDGTIISVEPKNGTDFSLEELQGFVGGHIEIVRYSDSQILICNEEGRIKNLPTNWGMMAVANSVGWIHGDVLVCPASQVE